MENLRRDELAYFANNLNPRFLPKHIEVYSALAHAEERTTGDYRGRYLFELLQNAHDAIRDATDDPAWPNAGARVRIEVTSTAVIVANDGRPFLDADVDSIRQWGESRKNPNKGIGHKGIGFKSVMEVTDAPEVFSGEFCFRFDRTSCQREVRRVLAGQAAVPPLPVTRFLFAYDLARVPEPDRSRVDELLCDDGFKTVIRLPFRSGTAPADAAARVREDVRPDLLLFLTAVDEIEVRLPDEPLWRLCKRVVRCIGDAREVVVEQTGATDRCWLLFEAPKRPVMNRRMLDQLGDKAWARVEKVGFAVAVPLAADGTLDTPAGPRPIHVYLPTKERSGFRFLVHGDFYVDSARKSIDEDTDYNKWLASEVAEYVVGTVAPALRAHAPDGLGALKALLPGGEPTGIGTRIRAAVVARLPGCACVPTDGGWVAPTGIVLPPPGAAVDGVLFRRFFPEAELARRGRHYPSQAVEADGEVGAFVAGLGAQRLSFADAFRTFGGHDLAGGPSAYATLFAYLWEWHQRLGSTERSAFEAALRATRCVPTQDGTWVRPEDRPFHARVGQVTGSMPHAVSVRLVHADAYGATGTQSGAYRLLQVLGGVRGHDAPEIVRSVVVPRLRPDAAERLSAGERAELVRYLFDYWNQSRGRAEPDPDGIRGEVAVPARPAGNGRKRAWRPAGEVYLASPWTDDGRLEEVYANVAGAWFLADPPSLEVVDAQRADWAAFWVWLGVRRTPRVLTDDDYNGHPWETVADEHPHGGTTLWRAYVRTIAPEGRCPVHGTGARRLVHSVALHGLSELIEQRDRPRLLKLFCLLAESWSTLRSEVSQAATLVCVRRSCATSRRISRPPSFAEYLLRRAEWVPVTVSGAPGLRTARRAWVVPEAEEAAVRAVLPALSPPATTPDPAFRSYAGVRSVADAQLPDLVDMLAQLPAECPDPTQELAGAGRRPVSRAPAFARWVARRINNLLAPMAASARPTLATRPAIVVEEAGQFRYAEPDQPVFHADDPVIAAPWRPLLAFAHLDQSWTHVARYLGLRPISSCIRATCEPGVALEDESRTLARRLARARPYLLAVVGRVSRSTLEADARRLARLSPTIVDGLVVERRLTVPPATTLRDEAAPTYLVPEEGVLYVRQPNAADYDRIGRDVAAYVEHPNLGADFVLLLHRADPTDRQAYLESLGITREDVEEVRALLRRIGAESPDDGSAPSQTAPGVTDIAADLLARIDEGGQPTSHTETVEGAAPPATGGATGSTTVAPPAAPVRSLPVLDMGGVVAVRVGRTEVTSPRVGGGWPPGVPHDWERRDALRRLYGERGEEVVYRHEVRRLEEAGMADAARRVRWLRQEGDDDADHDIESLEFVEGRWVPVVIEVKATPGHTFRFPMSVAELILAKRCAERGERYRLARVVDVTSASPPIYEYGNPYELYQAGAARFDLKESYVTLPRPD